MATTKPITAELTLPELVEALTVVLATGYDGAQSGRVRDLPDGRTIRWYQTLGMVDRPAAFRGRTALYGRRHLLQLAAIKKLQSSGLPLAEIQRGLAGRTAAELARSAGVALKDVDRVIEQAALTRSKAAATKLAAAVDGAGVAPSRPAAFWKLTPSMLATPARPASTPAGMQSVSLADAGMLLWHGRELTAAERATLSRLSGPVVEFLKSVQSSAADTQAEGAPTAASPARRPDKRKGASP